MPRGTISVPDEELVRSWGGPAVVVETGEAAQQALP
jgi:hypothetical protein